MKSIIILFIASSLFAVVPNYRGAEYVKLSNETITFQWTVDPENPAAYYDIKPIWIDVTPAQEYAVVSTPNNRITFGYPGRAGRFVYAARACNQYHECSAWSFTNDINAKPVVENEQGETELCVWRVLWRLAPPVIVDEVINSDTNKNFWLEE